MSRRGLEALGVKLVGSLAALALVIIAIANEIGFPPGAKTDPPREIPPTVSPVAADPLPEPKQPQYDIVPVIDDIEKPASCAGRLYGDEVCVDHFGANKLYFFRMEGYSPPTATRPYGIKSARSNPAYEAAVLLDPLHRNFVAWDWNEYAADRISVRGNVVPLPDVLADIEDGLGRIVAEFEEIRSGASPASGQGNVLRFEIGDALFSWKGVVTAAVFTYCVYGDGRGYCRDIIKTTDVRKAGLSRRCFGSALPPGGAWTSGPQRRLSRRSWRSRSPMIFSGAAAVNGIVARSLSDSLRRARPAQDVRSHARALFHEARTVCGDSALRGRGRTEGDDMSLAQFAGR